MLDPGLDLAAEGFTATLRRSVAGSHPDVRVILGPTFAGAASTAEQAMAAAALGAAVIDLDDPPTL